MKRAVLEQVMRSFEHTNVAGDKVTLPEGLRIDVLVSGGAETIPVSAVKELILGELYVTAVTDKDESYFVEYEHVLAVRTKGKATGHRIGRAGFAND